VTAIFFPPQTSCEELARIHGEALALWKLDKPTLQPTRVQSADDYIHFVRRFDSVLAKIEQAKGFAKTDPKEAAARAMLEQNRIIWGSDPHEIRITSLADFPNLDHAFYERYQQQLESKCFRFLADKEDMTMSRVFPHMRAMMRVMVSSDGSVCSAAFHIRNLSPEIKAVDFETELSDGTFLASSNAPDRTLPVPGVDARHYPTSTSVDDLWQYHQERLSAKLSNHPWLSAVLVRTVEDNIQMQSRQHELKAKHKREAGLVNAEDIKKIKGRQLLPHEQDIVVELERIKAAEEERANTSKN
jgi:hypothetical protein